MYRWKGEDRIVATILADSICKWLRGIRHTDTQSLPGINLQKAILRVKDRTLDVSSYKIIIVHISTNDIHSSSPLQITEKMEELTDLIREINPSAKIAISGMLPRPIDDPSPWVEANRRKTNISLRKSARKRGMYFVESWRAVLHKKIPIEPTPQGAPSGAPSTSSTAYPPTLVDDPSKVTSQPAQPKPGKKYRRKQMPKGEMPVDITCYGDDLLHLSNKGIIALGKTLQGNVITLMDPKK
jgi:lysophospholipase L1-like esterase